MSNIDNILTREEKVFIKSQGLDISDFYDVRGLGGPKKYHDIAKANGCRFVISNYCENGHRLKTRSGHCIMCKTATILVVGHLGIPKYLSLWLLQAQNKYRSIANNLNFSPTLVIGPHLSNAANGAWKGNTSPHNKAMYYLNQIP